MADGTADTADTLRRLDRLIWALVAMVAVCRAGRAAGSATSISNGASFGARPPAQPGALRRRLVLPQLAARSAARLRAGMHGAAHRLCRGRRAAVLSRRRRGRGHPAAGRTCSTPSTARSGFDWMALLRWLNDAPVDCSTALRLIYGSLLPQMALAVLCLAFTGRLVWLRIFMLAFIFAALVTIAISAVLPAAGVWLHYGLTERTARVVPVVSTVWPVFTGLRDGSVRALVAVGAEGVITFPSLHAALAVIMIAALWPIRCCAGRSSPQRRDARRHPDRWRALPHRRASPASPSLSLSLLAARAMPMAARSRTCSGAAGRASKIPQLRGAANVATFCCTTTIAVAASCDADPCCAASRIAFCCTCSAMTSPHWCHRISNRMAASSRARAGHRCIRSIRCSDRATATR